MSEPAPAPPPPPPPPAPPEDDLTAVLEERVRLRRQDWPPALTLAADTGGDFAALVDGLGVVRFTSADDLHAGWVRLHLADGGDLLRFTFPRGVEVRLENVVWVAECPDG